MTLVIGIGNRDRGDDAVGLAVAEQIRAAGLTGVTVLEIDGDQLALLDAWDDADEVYLVDAISSGEDPGTVRRFDARGVIAAPFARRGTHLFSLADVIELARALGRLPARVSGFGIEGAGYELGAPLSPQAQHAAHAVAGHLLRELRRAG